MRTGGTPRAEEIRHTSFPPQSSSKENRGQNQYKGQRERVIDINNMHDNNSGRFFGFEGGNWKKMGRAELSTPRGGRSLSAGHPIGEAMNDKGEIGGAEWLVNTPPFAEKGGEN